MSTAQALSAVKEALLEKLHHEVVPQLEQLVQALPEQLVDFAQAETQLRDGLLKVAQHLLEIWGHVADVKVARPQLHHVDFHLLVGNHGFVAY